MTGTEETTSWLPPYDDETVQCGRRLVQQNGGLLIVGPPGSGRLSLARSIAEPAVPRIHRGTLASVSSPYYALRLLAPYATFSEDSSPAQVALELGRQRPDELTDVTVVLIDADLCDPASLSTLIERAANGDITLIGTLRPEALQHQPLLSTAPTIQLPMLRPAGVARLLRHRFGKEPDRVAVEFVHARSQGIHDAVITVTESALSYGLLGEIDDTLTLMPAPGHPDELAPVALSAGSFRVHDLLDVSQDLTDMLQIVALVDEVDVHELMSRFPPSVLDLAVTHGVLRIIDDSVRFVLDAEAAAVDATLTLPRRIEIHDLYKQDFPRTFELPRAALRSALCRRKVRRPVEPELVARAARQANLEGLYREALTITQPASDDEPLAGPMERAFALVELGEVSELVTLLEDTDPGTLTEEELTDFILLRWTYLPRRGDDDEDVLTGDEENRRRRAAVLQLATLWATAFRRGGNELESEIRALIFSGILCPLNTATAYLALSAVQRNGGRPAQAVASARAALDILHKSPVANAFVVEPAHEVLIIALLDTLDFAATEDALAAYSSRTAPHGRVARMGHALWGLLEHSRGKVALALTHARLCLESLQRHDPQQILPWVQALNAELLAQHGRFDEAEAMLATPDVHRPPVRLQHDLEGRIARAMAFDAIGHLDEAIRLLQDVVTHARQAGLRKSEIDAAAALVQIAGPTMVPQLSRAVARLDEPTGVPAVWTAFVAAVEAQDMGRLFALVADLADRGAQVLAAEISQFTLDFAGEGRELSMGQRLLLQHLTYASDGPSAGSS